MTADPDPAAPSGSPNAALARAAGVDQAALRTRLLAWYDGNARDLPWRRTDDPYAIWVSEVMLQQTRVDTVVPYWERWMERYATVDALADAELDEVLKSWEGLGYYRRARMLHRAAGVVRERHGGSLPDDPGALRTLPGVGEYTAGAVASIAFGRAVPAVDGNVRRVLSRLFDLPDPTPASLRDRAAALVDPERPGDFNQALMELGATVCTPAAPECGACPVAGACVARARGVQEERPVARKRGPVPERRFGVAVPWRRGPEDGSGPELLLVRRPEEGMLGGLWAFPAARIQDGDTAAEAAVRALDTGAGRRPESLREPSPDPGEESVPLDEVRHVYSHFRGVYVPFLTLMAGTGEELEPFEEEARWLGLAEATELPLPVAWRRILEAAVRALEAR